MWRVEADVIFERSRRRFLERSDPLQMEEADFVDRYRFPKTVVTQLSRELDPYLSHHTRRSNSLTVEQQVCVALRYYAEGDYMRDLGDLHGISEMSAGCAVHDVSNALSEVHHRFICWPTSQEISMEKERFYRYCGMPKTIGYIDGTQIRILAPAVNEKVYVNRKGWHAINCQIICDSNLKIFDIPGKSKIAWK